VLPTLAQYGTCYANDSPWYYCVSGGSLRLPRLREPELVTSVFGSGTKLTIQSLTFLTFISCGSFSPAEFTACTVYEPPTSSLSCFLRNKRSTLVMSFLKLWPWTFPRKELKATFRINTISLGRNSLKLLRNALLLPSGISVAPSFQVTCRSGGSHIVMLNPVLVSSPTRSSTSSACRCLPHLAPVVTHLGGAIESMHTMTLTVIV